MSSISIKDSSPSSIWLFIIQHYLPICAKHSKEQGPGISIFRVKSKEVNPETQYTYCSKDGKHWNLLKFISPYFAAIEYTYDPSKHFLVNCMAMKNDETALIGAIDYEFKDCVKIFSYENLEEIKLDVNKLI